MNEENVLVILTGISASGKSTVAKRFIKNGYTSPYNFTTRPKRSDEERDEYVFLTDDMFEQFKREDRLAENIIYGDYQYGMSKYGYGGKTFAILEPRGREIILNAAEDGLLCGNDGLPIKNLRVETVFIDISKGLQEQRLKERGDSKEEIKKRMRDDFQPTPSCLVVEGWKDPLVLFNEIEDELYKV